MRETDEIPIIINHSTKTMNRNTNLIVQVLSKGETLLLHHELISSLPIQL